MADKKKFIIPTQGGVFRDLLLRLKLIGSLMLDKRVNPLIKLIPVASLVYLISPIDALVGPIDDAGVLALATYLFIELCPTDVVNEHARQLSSNNDMVDKQAKSDVIDGEVIDDGK
jgi:uncharacterized membrane protein YkvA (DUF1232 family)